jgi:hypothetical protein
MDRIVAARVLVTDETQTSIQTREKGMRSDDRSFAALLLVEGLNETAVRDALARLQERDLELARDAGDLPLYAVVFSLGSI